MVARSRYCLCGTSGVHSLEAAWAEGGVSLEVLERVPMPGAEWRPRPVQGDGDYSGCDCENQIQSTIK